MVMKGNYNSSSTYEILDVVTYNNGTYIAKANVPANTDPSNTSYWQEAVTVPEESIMGTPVDLTSYTSESPYTCPSNGYVSINGRNNTSGYIRMYIKGKNYDSTSVAMAMNITAAYQMDVVYVHKNMKVYIDTNISDIIARFIPLS